MNVRTFLASTSFAAFVLVVGCATTTEQYLGAERDPEPPPLFVEDAGPDAPDSTFELTSYCPSSQCSTGLTTCPNSRFPCDVDLRSDSRNCGSCGFTCPSAANGAVFECAEGKCQMTCTNSPPRLDCNGIVDDGCEVTADTNENCGQCGATCTDPESPCLTRKGLQRCGCPTPEIACKTGIGFACVDATGDDANCGACGNVCDPTNGGAPSYANAYYGCRGSSCGHLKCEPFWADCNANAKTDGCETFLLSDQNCGGCGNTCPAGMGCYLNIKSFQIECMCPPGKTLCEIVPGFAATCVDITSDPQNCGGCGVTCSGSDSPSHDYMFPSCRSGSCETRCEMGRADCNGNDEDGCEIDTNSDPRNCGACGHACDEVVGQACIGGRCAVEPCDVDAGEVTTR
ncbi:MAG: hypothetical protein BGO98_34625 [Myxococcales bacterium 68-20]|nr:hypothetical protein [Myxococcales bacterium]OJY21970.1 MAG: hypothetical protein BGO98_34625 [Myxococcales bacterium 68-20]